MILSEEEAKGKWCPFARAANEIGADAIPVNRQAHSEIDPDCTCVGSRCMAWRWYEFETADDGKRTAGTRGMCGLAGRQF